VLRTRKQSGSWCPVSSPVLRPPRIAEAGGKPRHAPRPAFRGCTQNLSLLPGTSHEPSSSAGEGCPGTVSPRWSPPAQPCQPQGHAPPCSTKAAAVQARIWLRSLWQERTLSFSEHQAQTDEVVFACTQASIYSALRRLSLSRAPVSQLPVSSSRRENIGSRSQGLLSFSSTARTDSLFGLT